jgi:hypothetical protein
MQMIGQGTGYFGHTKLSKQGEKRKGKGFGEKQFSSHEPFGLLFKIKPFLWKILKQSLFQKCNDE